MARQLTLKQRRFVQELPLARSQTEAAIKAGYSPRVAREVGSENLAKPHVAAAVSALVAKAEGTAIATVVERKGILSTILRDKLPGPYPVQAVIAASDQLNRMDSLYIDRSAAVTVHIDALDTFSVDELRQLLGKMNDEKGAFPSARIPPQAKQSRRRKS